MAESFRADKKVLVLKFKPEKPELKIKVAPFLLKQQNELAPYWLTLS